MSPTADSPVSAVERSFYEAEFAGSTLVVALSELDNPILVQLRRVATSLQRTGAHLVVVTDLPRPGAGWAPMFGRALGDQPIVLDEPTTSEDSYHLADLWLAIADGRSVVVDAGGEPAVTVAGRIAASLRARKLIVTDPDGGWGDPPRSFADVEEPGLGIAAALADRRGGLVVPAIEAALAGGVLSVNLCRARDLDRELFTFDGTGTLFTSGGYLRVEPLRVEDLPVVERLVAQGTTDGVLRPRGRREVARLASTGLGARVLGGDHLAGIVSLETEPYRAERMGEVACLYAVSRFSGAGAGGMLVDALVAGAGDRGLDAVFAVTVSDAAAGFFARKGFDEVAQDEVPAVKWSGYDEARRARARAFLRSTGRSDPA